MTCTLTGTRVKCTCPENAKGSRYTFVPKSQCKRWDNPNAGLDLPIVNLTECVHRGDELYTVNCGCAMNPVDVPVCACALHAQCVPAQYDRIAEKLRQQDQKPKACTGCKDVWIPELERTAIVAATFGNDPLREQAREHWHMGLDDYRHLLIEERCESSNIFVKEDVYNRSLSQLPEHIEFVAFIDNDLIWPDSRWLQHGIKLLDTCKIVQGFSKVRYLQEDGSTEAEFMSAAARYLRGETDHGHQGGCWIAGRETWEQLGGWPLMPTGNADFVFWSCVTGKEWDVVTQAPADWVEEWKAYADNARAVIGNAIGCVDVIVDHVWHGSIKSRDYGGRWGNLLPRSAYRTGNAGLLELVNG